MDVLCVPSDADKVAVLTETGSSERRTVMEAASSLPRAAALAMAAARLAAAAWKASLRRLFAAKNGSPAPKKGSGMEGNSMGCCPGAPQNGWASDGEGATTTKATTQAEASRSAWRTATRGMVVVCVLVLAFLLTKGGS